MTPWTLVDRLLDSVIGAVSRFSRKRPPDLNRRFNRPHFAGTSGLCVYCGKRFSGVTQCPGPSL